MLFALLLLVAGSLRAQTLDLRIAAANLSSGNNQNYDDGAGLRILDGVNPDVVMIQEFNYLSGSAANYRALVDSTFGTNYSYYVEPTGNIPNGIISRYPILAAGYWDDPRLTDREFVWARIDLPGDIDLWAISVHLKASSGSASDRATEATNLANYISANVPANAYVVIGGDFNTYSRTEAALTNLSQSVVTTGAYPTDQNGNADTNAGRSSPYDGVYASANLNALKTSTLLGNSLFANGAVVDTRVFSSMGTLSDLSPALSGDSAATNMQHMAVVRDFLIAVPEPTSASLLVFVGFFLVRKRRPKCA
jgi:endonuclease/exonuclease/phosphatase family metal-dependent hydrolase